MAYLKMYHFFIMCEVKNGYKTGNIVSAENKININVSSC
jgi:hypothetical protein